MQYNRLSVFTMLGVGLVFSGPIMAQAPDANVQIPVHLQVDAGTPIRVYITRRISYRLGETVPAKVIEPVWAFDRIVIPAGSTLQGKIVGLDPVSGMVRTRAIVGGDFTPLKRAEVAFNSLTLPGGRVLPLETAESLGLATLYVPPPKRPKTQKASNGKAAQAGHLLRQQAQNQIESQARARSYGFYDLVRGPNKVEWLEDFAFSKLPYHPQWYRTRTRFDSVLIEPLDFGTVNIAASEIAKPGTSAPPNSIAQMRLLNTVSSADAHISDPIEGVLTEPLFAEQKQLVLPQGTHFTGKVTAAQKARLFHRGGKLRFTIDSVDLPKEDTAVLEAASARTERTSQPVQGQLVAVEADPKAVKVDSEGTATATESKTRLLRPAIAALIAAKSLDNDEGRQTASGGSNANLGGRTLGGFSGFGMLGTLASFGPHQIGVAFGFYGLGMSVYSNVISRGREVTFEKNTAIAIKFGPPRNK